MADVIALRLLAEAADGHVLDHAVAKRADGLLAHWSGPCLEVGGSEPLDPQDRTLRIRYRAPIRHGLSHQHSPARAGSSFGPRQKFAAQQQVVRFLGVHLPWWHHTARSPALSPTVSLLGSSDLPRALTLARGTHVSPRDPLILILLLPLRQPLLRDALLPIGINRA